MSAGTPEGTGVTFIDLEFDTGTTGGALLGDIASSLVCVDELLRDLASIAAAQSSAEFRNIEIAAIEMQSPLKIRLSLLGISPEAVMAFQEVCRRIIVFRERRAELCIPKDVHARITEQELQRLCGHVLTLQNAAIPLKHVKVKEE
jgi:hypothetical protein